MANENHISDLENFFGECVLFSENKPIEFNDPTRVNIVSGFSPKHSAYIYSRPFISNKDIYTTLNFKPHCLDSVYSKVVIDDNAVVGPVIGFGDGCGGHDIDAREDLKIANASFIASKTAVDEMLHYLSADELKKDLEIDIEHLRKREKLEKLLFNVEQATRDIEKNTTLQAVRAYKQPDGRYRIVGIGIGDSMLFAYNPNTHEFKTICPGIQKKAQRSNLSGTAQFPHRYNYDEVYLIDELLDPDTKLFVVSDGVYNYLPMSDKIAEKTGIDGNTYEYLTLDAEKMSQLLSSVATNAPATDFLKVVMTCAYQQIEEKRQQAIQTSEDTQKEFEIFSKMLTQTMEKYGVDSDEVQNLQKEYFGKFDSIKYNFGDDCSGAVIHLPSTAGEADYLADAKNSLKFSFNQLKTAIEQSNDSFLKKFATQFDFKQVQEHLVTAANCFNLTLPQLHHAQKIIYKKLYTQPYFWQTPIIKKYKMKKDDFIKLHSVESQNGSDNNNNNQTATSQISNTTFLHKQHLRKVFYEKNGKITFFVPVGSQATKFEEKYAEQLGLRSNGKK